MICVGTNSNTRADLIIQPQPLPIALSHRELNGPWRLLETSSISGHMPAFVDHGVDVVSVADIGCWAGSAAEAALAGDKNKMEYIQHPLCDLLLWCSVAIILF